MLFFLLIQNSARSLAITVRQEDKIRGVQIGKKEETLSLLTENKILYVENSKDSAPHTKKNG